MRTQPPSAYDEEAELRRVECEAYPSIEEMQHEAVRPVPRLKPLTLAERFNEGSRQ